MKTFPSRANLPKELVRDLWVGDVPLVVAFWGFGFFGTMLLSISWIAVFSDFDGFLVRSVFIVIATAYQVLVSVGVWRSSRKYRGNKLYSTIAKVTVFVSCFFAIPNIILAMIAIPK